MEHNLPILLCMRVLVYIVLFHPAFRENCVFNCQYMACEEDIHRANLIRELMQVRDGHLPVPMRSVRIE